MKHRAVLLLLLLIAAAPLAHAQGEKGMYIGATLGSIDYEESADVFDFAVSDSTYTYRFFGGYRFNDYFAVEGGAGRTGSLEESFDDVPFGPFGPVRINLDQVLDIYTITALGFVPLDRISLFGGVGYFSASIGGDAEAEGLGTLGGIDGHDSGASAVLGVQRDFGLDLRNLSVRAQYQWYDWESGVDGSEISVGMIFRF
jgi:OOP family OmpA-OmpF porin